MEQIKGLSPGDVVSFEQRLRSGNFRECLITEIDLSRPLPFTVKDVSSGELLAGRAENIRATYE